MTTIFRTILLLMMVLLAACGGMEGDETLGFNDEGQRVVMEVPQIAPLPSPVFWRVDPPVFDPEQRMRQREVEQLIAERYREQRWRIVETTQTYIGDVLDWIDPASLRGPRATPPPPLSPEEVKPSPGAQLQVTELDMYPELRGPKGTIPIVRPTFAAYVRGDTKAASLKEYLTSFQPPGRTRLYAGIAVKKTNQGVVSRVSDFNGAVEANSFTVIETAVMCPGSNPDTTFELVGMATSKDQTHFKNSVLRLQFEFATRGETAADYVGGWNGTKYGFVLASTAPYSSGIALVPVSTIFGPQYESYFEIRLLGGNWWLNHNGNWLGYYEGFRFDMLNSGGCEAHWYGEVYDPTPTDWTYNNLGSGRHASYGAGQAAYVMRPAYLDMAGVFRWPDGAGSSSPSDSACYTKSSLSIGPPGQDRFFYVGGPGGDGAGCN